MEDLYYLAPIGWIHLIAAIISLITGTWVFLTQKATQLHKAIGYIYVVGMGAVVATSFMIYRLFNGFGIAIISAFTLLGGMLPMFKKERGPKELEQHIIVMSWSV